MLLMQLPGQEPQPAGILLLDLAADRLHVRLRDDLKVLDEDVAEIWALLGPDLEQKSSEMGGLSVVQWLENEASLTFTVADHRHVWISTVESTMKDLFREHITASKSPAPAVITGQTFSASEIADVYDRMPVSRLIGLQALRILQNPRSDLEDVEAILSQDPVLTAHFINLANSALLSRGPTVKSVGRALLLIGFDQAKLHIWGISVRRLYSSPHLQSIWNHSVQTVQVARELSDIAGFAQVNDAMLAALVHDIGQIALAALGDRYQNRYARLRAEGYYPTEIERRLCGVDHAQIGADLLSAWNFPPDLVEAVRYHHAPTQSGSALAHLLYLAESWTDSGEDIYDRVEHAHIAEGLHLPSRQLTLGRKRDADLHLLRFAA